MGVHFHIFQHSYGRHYHIDFVSAQYLLNDLMDGIDQILRMH